MVNNRHTIPSVLHDKLVSNGLVHLVQLKVRLIVGLGLLGRDGGNGKLRPGKGDAKKVEVRE